MQLEEATDIQSYIEQREHNFNLELEEVNQKYEEILGSYQAELEELKGQLIKWKELSESKAREASENEEKVRKQRMEQEKHCLEFEEIVNEYHSELESKDHEILALKRSIG